MRALFWRRRGQARAEEPAQPSPARHLYSLSEQAPIPPEYDPLSTDDMLRYATEFRGFASIDNLCSTREAREILEKLEAARKNGLDLAQSLPEEDSTREVNPTYLIQERIKDLARRIDAELIVWCRHPSRPKMYISYQNVTKEEIDYIISALRAAKEALGNTESGQWVARRYDKTVLRVYRERPDLLSPDMLQYYIDVVAPFYREHGDEPDIEKRAIVPNLRALPVRA